MNKTLIALAVAFSAVSGTAAAWTPDANSVQFEIGGTLTAAELGTPWEVGVGTDFGNIQPLDANITKGVNKVTFQAENAIPVLGIRTLTNEPFQGRAGIAPIINFGEALDPDKFEKSSAPLTLMVKDESGNELGKLSTRIFAGAIYSANDNPSAFAIVTKDQAFYGGLPKEISFADTPGNIKSRLDNISSKFAENFNYQNLTLDGYRATKFWYAISKYSAYYGAGIEKNSDITISLNNQVDGNITWKAALPITITYS